MYTPSKILPFFIILKITLCSSEENPEVTTDLGKIQGYHKLSFEKKKISAFEGIPYAKPPIGNNRFKEPIPIEKWDGTWQANHLCKCAQLFPSVIPNIIGDEDCLYLDVYVPSEKINPSANYNVIVHIHGGGFMFGSGHLYSFPEYLMDHNIIFVNFNYRLGVFGFLSTEDDVVPGNNGFKDQVLALQWVKNNIANFGGNPNSVTLTGASAGAASVHLHYFSKLSKGLFQRGFSQSGCALNSWVFQTKALDTARTLALQVGCLDDSSKDFINCLRRRNFRQILEATRVLYPYTEIPFLPFSAVIETGSDGFITGKPQELMESQEIQDLPWLASIVEDESVGLFGNFLDRTQEFEVFFNNFASLMLNYNYTVPRDKWDNLRDTIRGFYINKNQKYKNQNISEIFQILSDRMFAQGVAKCVKLQAKWSKSKSFLFKFGYTEDSRNLVGHGSDNQYFYYNSKETKPTDNQLKMKNIMIKMLLEYIKTDEPFVEGIEWKHVTENKLNFLDISGFDNHVKSITDNNLGNQEFWNSLELLKNE